MSTELPRYALEQISTPTLVISTETDLFGTFQIGRYTAEQIAGARFLGYPTGGHIWVGHDREMWSEIAAFLNDRL
jgi:pimeloyl-ACP methyl ester carboxylesterase